MDLVFDLEATYSYKGKMVKGVEKQVSDIASPYNPNNTVVCVGVHTFETGYILYDLQRHDSKKALFNLMDEYDVIVGHNVKYDVNWLRKLGWKPKKSARFVDTMVNEATLTGGKRTMKNLALDKLATEYGGTPKIDIIKKYWKLGANTDEIPRDILHAYQYLDVYNTRLIWEEQKKEMR